MYSSNITSLKLSEIQTEKNWNIQQTECDKDSKYEEIDLNESVYNSNNISSLKFSLKEGQKAQQMGYDLVTGIHQQ